MPPLETACTRLHSHSLPLSPTGLSAKQAGHGGTWSKTQLVELLRRIDEPLLFLMPHEGIASLTKFCDSSANAGGNENQQRLVANASLTTMVNDLLDALFESNSGLSAAIRSARTPATKIMEALDCLGLRPERIIKTCQATTPTTPLLLLLLPLP